MKSIKYDSSDLTRLLFTWPSLNHIAAASKIQTRIYFVSRMYSPICISRGMIHACQILTLKLLSTTLWWHIHLSTWGCILNVAVMCLWELSVTGLHATLYFYSRDIVILWLIWYFATCTSNVGLEFHHTRITFQFWF